MDDRDSASSEMQCTRCGREVPPEGCETNDCSPVTAELLYERPTVIAHDGTLFECPVCARLLGPDEKCDRPDCPRIAVEQIRKASIDTPFKLGI